MAQRWIVVHSDHARERANKTLTKAVTKEKAMLTKAMWHLSRRGHACQHDAEKSALKEMKKAKYHQIESIEYTTKNDYKSRGRPSKDSQSERINHYITVIFKQNNEEIDRALAQRSCYVIGTNVNAAELSDIEVLAAYKRQNASIENMGFRFLKNPKFFANSLFLKKTSRIMSAVTMMNMSLLVYSIAQRRLRMALIEKNQTLPNQIKKPIKNVTMQWIFQLMKGIYVLYREENGKIINAIRGIHDLRKKIIRLLGKTTMEIYGVT